MRRIFACCALATLLCGCAMMRSGGGKRPVSATDVVVVVPSNGVWDAEFGRTDDRENCSYEFYLARLEDGVAVEVRVTDDRCVVDDSARGDVAAPVWNDDSVICIFDGDMDRSLDSRDGDGFVYGGGYALAANGAATSDFSAKPRGFGKEWFGSVSPGEGNATRYSFFFPWKSIGIPRPPRPEENVAFGFNICFVDDDDGGRADRALYWTGNPTLPYRDESRFGTINLKGVGR